MKNDNYATDEWIMKLFAGWHDPCPMASIPKTDGLLIDWGDKTFVNPPYSNPLPWVEKAIKESQKGNMIVMLLKVDTSTKWFMKLQEAGAKFLFINGRLKYNTGKSANFPSMIVILENRTH